MRRIALAAVLLACAAAVAQDEEPETYQVRAQALCEGGRLTGIRLFVPVPGVVTIPIPETVCRGQPQRAPEPRQRPGLTT